MRLLAYLQRFDRNLTVDELLEGRFFNWPTDIFRLFFQALDEPSVWTALFLPLEATAGSE